MSLHNFQKQPLIFSQLSNEKKLQEELLAIVEHSREDLISFQIATNPKYSPNWHHEIVAKELHRIEKEGDDYAKILIVIEPPRHGKSQQSTIDFPSWYLGKNPDKEVITVSYSAEFAQTFGGKTRDKINSESYRLIFPGVQVREDERAKGHWRTKQGGGYVSVGVGGPITGMGANILILDDLVKNREEAESEIYRERIWDWFTSTAYTRLEPKGVVIIANTRWHLDDIVGRVLNSEEFKKRTKIIKFSAISEFVEKPHRGQHEALWPDKYDLRELISIQKSIGPYDWSALYQGSPILTEKQEFRPEWNRTISESIVQMMSTRRFLTVDSSMSKKTSSDYTGFCDNRVNTQNFWHLKAWRQRLGPEELVDQLFTLQERNHYEGIGLEKTSYTVGLKPYLDSEQRKRGKYLPIVELQHNNVNKEVRIRGLIPRYAAGSVYHIIGECNDLEDEMRNFPLGAHDDTLDATAYQDQIADDNLHTQEEEKIEVFDKHGLF